MTFITGSQVYGNPSADADVDIVMLVSKADMHRLIGLSDYEEFPVRYGRMNLILCGTQDQYDAWKESCQKCKLAALDNNGSIDRDTAVAIHTEVFKEYGVTKWIKWSK
jgi:hypothetical protein